MSITTYYASGNKYIQYNYVNNRREGRNILFYDVSRLTIKMETYYKNDIAGTFMTYYECGCLSSHGNHVDGKMKVYEYYDCDCDLSYMEIIPLAEYSTMYKIFDYRNGLHVDNYTNIMEKRIYNCRNGKLHGEYIAFHRNNMVRIHTYFKNNELDGKFVLYDEKGFKLLECNYRQGKLHGEYVLQWEEEKYENYEILKILHTHRLEYDMGKVISYKDNKDRDCVLRDGVINVWTIGLDRTAKTVYIHLEIPEDAKRTTLHKCYGGIVSKAKVIGVYDNKHNKVIDDEVCSLGRYSIKYIPGNVVQAICYYNDPNLNLTSGYIAVSVHKENCGDWM